MTPLVVPSKLYLFRNPVGTFSLCLFIFILLIDGIKSEPTSLPSIIRLITSRGLCLVVPS